MHQHAVICQDVCMKIKKKDILNKVSFQIPTGSITGLLGPNGAGKSSIIRLISGLNEADSGEIEIFGEPAGVSRLSQMALLPDRGKLPGWLLAEQWLLFAKGIYPDWNEEYAQALIEKLKINTDTRISAMSRGEESRLQLLTCLSRKSPLIILDEPFTGVDMISREHIASTVVSDLADGERTFIIATHDIREMEALFDRLVLLNDGKVQAVDEVDELRRNGKSVESRYREVFS